MMRFWFVLVLLILTGCSSSEPPDEAIHDDLVDTTGQADKNPPVQKKEEPLTPVFTPSQKTPITRPDEPKQPQQPPAAPQVKLDEKMKQAVANLVNDDPKVRDQAQVDLESSDNKSVEILLVAAKDPKAEVRAGAVYGLSGQFNQFHPPMMRLLRESLGDSDPRVRSLAVSAVSEMPAKMLAPAIGDLANILTDSSEPAHVRAAAARLLSKLSVDDLDSNQEDSLATVGFAALKKGLLTDTDRSVRLACLGGIEKLAPAPEDAVLVLSEVLMESKDNVLRRRAALLLGDLGEQATSAAPTLILTLNDKDPQVASAAAGALLRMGSSAVPLLAEKAVQGEKSARLLAIDVLAKLGPTANSSKLLLEQAAQDPDQEIQAAAQAALQAINQ